MTNRQLDVNLQEAFKGLADRPGAGPSDELREHIWLAVSGELPPRERRALIDRMATDAACAEAWRVAHEMWEAFQLADRGVALGHTTGGSSSWIAVAAAVLLAATTGIVSLVNQPPADEFRTSPGYAVTALVPADTPLPRGEFRLRWTPGPEGSRYQVRVTTEDLQVLTTATDVAAPEFVMPIAQLAALPDGARVFWQVDVSLPTGERITSPTFVARVR